MTHQNTRAFIGAFMVTAVCIGAVCGFMLVDLRTDRYMQGEFPPIFLVSEVNENGADIAWMGTRYHMDAQAAGKIQGKIWEYRGLLPHPLRIAGALAVWTMDFYTDAIENTVKN